MRVRRSTCISMLLAGVLVVGGLAACGDDDEALTTTTSTAAAPRSTPSTEASSTTTTKLCEDRGPPPPEPMPVEVIGVCYKFVGVIESVGGVRERTEGSVDPVTGLFNYASACTANIAYGTTPPMIDEPRSIHVLEIPMTDSAGCDMLAAVDEGDTVEVTARGSATDMGMFLSLQALKLREPAQSSRSSTAPS